MKFPRSFDANHPLAPEQDLIQMLRGQAGDFAITIIRRDGLFFICLQNDPEKGPESAAEGNGDSFAEAWKAMLPSSTKK